MFKKVVVGMSGGVDSAVACLILKNKGFQVTGCFMKNWDQVDETGSCQGDKDFEEANWICKKLDVPLVQVNFVKDYWLDVFSYTLESYQNGETPNPDIQCNKNIKFDKFYHFARKELQADAIATGHYANTSFGPFLQNYKENENVKLLLAKDQTKDQTFFLSQVKQESLRRCMFPLANYLKVHVKKIAHNHQLSSTAKKKESTGICFIGKRNFKDFLSEYVENKSGNFIDLETGSVKGKHDGQHLYTLGQGINAYPLSYYIAEKDSKTNDMFVVKGTKHPALFTDLVVTAEPYWIDKEPDQLRESRYFECLFRFQHLKPFERCKVFKTSSNKLIILLEKPLRSLTPGQYAVLYLNSECLGSAKITTPGPSMFALRPIENGEEDIEEGEAMKLKL